MRVQYALGFCVKLGVLLFTFFVLVAVYSSVSIPSANSSLVDSLPTFIPNQWQELCQFLEIKPSGVEGSFKNEKYSLRGLAIVFRHGERSSLHQNEEPGCLPFREKDRRAFANYTNLVKSDEFQYFLRKDKGFDHLKEVPGSSICQAGQLTAEGALMHVALGNYMRSKYGGSTIFNPESELNVTVTSSKYNRTLQSVIAFTSGFLYPLKTFLPQMYIKASNFSFMCTAEQCKCPEAVSWRRKYEKEHSSVFYANAPAQLRQEAYGIQSISSYKKSHDPFQIMDVSMGKYICRRRSLPCHDDNCVSFSFLSELLTYTTARGTFMFNEGSKYVARKLQLVEAYSVLFHLVEGIRLMRRFPHTNSIKIFSGHDVTVGPILRVLQIPFVDFPRYASRINFEIFEDVSQKNNLFVRVIHNGIDVTNKVQICEKLEDDLCPAEYFEKFLPQIMRQLGAKDMKSFCSSSTSNV